MSLLEIELVNWRSYTGARVEFDPGINLILGENAQGKTNLLEAVCMLSLGRSFRTRTAGELIRMGADYAEIQADVLSEQRRQQLRMVLFSDRRRRILQRNGIKQKTFSGMAGILHTVLFCPEDLQLLRAGSAGRRRLIDDALCQLRPAYAQLLSEYQRLEEQKSRILKDRYEKPDLLRSLPDYNERMAQTGAGLIFLRARYLQALDRAARVYHSELSGGREELQLQYRTVSGIGDPLAPRQELAQQLLRHIGERQAAELDAGSCLTGPHRDDFTASLGELPIKTYASQGQTRTAAIAIKLAEREILGRAFGQDPVLLLDDVLSELDAARQDYVLNRLGNGQVFITCCEEKKLTGIGRRFLVRGGSITCI